MFLDQASAGFYTGTTFHSMVANGIVQGGDPVTRDLDRTSEYGTGGFQMDLAPEFNDIDFVAGTVVATLLPGDPESAGSQFFICVGDQPQFTGQFTAFAHVVEGLDVVAGISTTATDENQIALERIEITDITFRPIPPPPTIPYSTETIDELGELAVVMDTSLGEIVLGMLPELAPDHVRHFLRLVSLEVYDQTAFHRVAPGFVIQGGDLNTRSEPYPASAREHVVPISAELSERAHTRGIVSLARGEEIDSGLTSFFVVLDDQPPLDGVYTVFGEVISGMETVDRIASVETEDERPLERVDVYTMRVERRN
jgi:peptidyl-prolyl cis-trans isomerase B (cyclophilin B)